MSEKIYPNYIERISDGVMLSRCADGFYRDIKMMKLFPKGLQKGHTWEELMFDFKGQFRGDFNYIGEKEETEVESYKLSPKTGIINYNFSSGSTNVTFKVTYSG